MNFFRMTVSAAGRTVLLAGCLIALGVQAAGPDRSADGADRVATLSKTRTLVSFGSDPKSARMPYSGVILATDGNFYGTTSRGGSGLVGTIFRMTPSGQRTTLHAFSGSDGDTPIGAPVEGPDGALYGVADVFDGSSAGVIYRMALDGTFAVLHSLKADRSEGFESLSRMVLARDGRLYGTLFQGGAYGAGTFFRVSLTGEFAVLASFRFDAPYNSFGCQPLEGDDGNFYLTAQAGGSHHRGGLLRVSPDGTVTTIYEFSKKRYKGANPSGALVYDAAHDYMFGTTFDGYFFRYRDGILETMARLPGQPAQLALGPDHAHFYVGFSNLDSVYSLTPDGEKGVVATLPGLVAWGEQMSFGVDGSMYGTTLDGGARGGGTVFRINRF